MKDRISAVGPTIEGVVIDKPKVPTRETVGRHAPPLWSYKGNLMPLTDATILYETDRANWAEARVKIIEDGLYALCEKYPGNGGYVMKEVRKLVAPYEAGR